MQRLHYRVSSCARLLMAILVAIMIATPVSAQFGGLKKKVKKATGAEETPPGAAPADAQGGTIVLTSDVLSQLLTGLKAGKVERDAAAREDTPYGRYKRAEIAYIEAQPKCEAGREAWIRKADPKEVDKASELNQKMIDAQMKQDYKRVQIYQDSASLLQGGPSCIVKEPEQPKDYYQDQRAAEVRAEKAEVKASGLGAGELALIKERVLAILGGTTPADASASEKSAVSAKAAELKPLLGFKEPEPVQSAKATPAPAQAAPVASPQMTAAQSNMSNCMMANMQKNQAKLEALGERAEAAQKAGNQPKIMALADTMRQIQMAGCQNGR